MVRRDPGFLVSLPVIALPDCDNQRADAQFQEDVCDVMCVRVCVCARPGVFVQVWIVDFCGLYAYVYMVICM